MKLTTILAWIMSITGVLLLPFLIIPVPEELLIPFQYIIGIFFISLLLFSAIETIKKKQYLILSLIFLVSILLIVSLISYFVK